MIDPLSNCLADLTRVQVTWFKAGYCTHPEAIVLRQGRWKTMQFPALFALIQHPTIGNILFDTGYSDRFFQETHAWPHRLYALVTPVFLQPEESAIQQLQQQGISPDSIRYIVISHFHADHIGGLRDFPNAEFICSQSAYEAVKHQEGLWAVKAGFLAGLLPPDFEQRVRWVEQQPTVSALPGWFDVGFDILGDRSLLAIELPGHATGQLGLLLVDTQEQPYFLVADACWSSRAFQELVPPHAIAQLIFSDATAYRTTLEKLHHLHQKHPEIRIVPTHCADFWRAQNPME
ncbi:MAG: MBL fold metallo-hydrolase [Oscillatoriophycideae cyanobacterium NC_groundwater_1537_Pr4_S-0.65um_50_18]|nr:MBL fold metallo-hydrolase [Oscillatoriophycideae cyanobacterium NC_groundwater_1537_Pr4_S-0.65um_50_18]